MNRGKSFNILTYEPFPLASDGHRQHYIRDYLSVAFPEFDFYVVYPEETGVPKDTENFHTVHKAEAKRMDEDGEFNLSLLHITGDTIRDISQGRQKARTNPFITFRDNVISKNNFIIIVHGKPDEMHNKYQEFSHGQPMVFHSYATSSFYLGQNKVVIYPYIELNYEGSEEEDEILSYEVHDTDWRRTNLLTEYLRTYKDVHQSAQGVGIVFPTTPLDDKWMFLTHMESTIYENELGVGFNIADIQKDDLAKIFSQQERVIRSIFNKERFRLDWFNLINQYVGL